MREPWEYEDPSCASVGGDFWFPDFDRFATSIIKTEEKKAEIKVAKSICNGCVHKIECQQWGLKHERYGIWGGLSEKERFSIRKRLNITIEEVGIADFTAGVGYSPHESNTSS